MSAFFFLPRLSRSSLASCFATSLDLVLSSLFAHYKIDPPPSLLVLSFPLSPTPKMHSAIAARSATSALVASKPQRRVAAARPRVVVARAEVKAPRVRKKKTIGAFCRRR